MDLVERINSCPFFAQGKCPHQARMERIYLIFQLIGDGDVFESKAMCYLCPKESQSPEQSPKR
jgi:hypothetical protein